MLAGYPANSNTFPQPLSEAEEARSVLIERILRLVAHIAKQLCAKLPKIRRNQMARRIAVILPRDSGESFWCWPS